LKSLESHSERSRVDIHIHTPLCHLNFPPHWISHQVAARTENRKSQSR